MSKYVLVCNGTPNITSNSQASCNGTWETIQLDMLTPTSQITPQLVAELFSAAVGVFLLAKAFQVIRRQFF